MHAALVSLAFFTLAIVAGGFVLGRMFERSKRSLPEDRDASPSFQLLGVAGFAIVMLIATLRFTEQSLDAAQGIPRVMLPGGEYRVLCSTPDGTGAMVESLDGDAATYCYQSPRAALRGWPAGTCVSLSESLFDWSISGLECSAASE